MAVVFPAPAGAIASCSRAPEVHNVADQHRLPGIKGGTIRGQLEHRQLHRRRVDNVPVPAAGGGDQTLLGVENPLRGVPVGAGDGVHR
jgi:hypothetical protein